MSALARFARRGEVGNGVGKYWLAGAASLFSTRLEVAWQALAAALEALNSL